MDLLQLAKEWIQERGLELHRPPYLGVASSHRLAARQLLDCLMGEQIMGRDIPLPRDGYLAIPYGEPNQRRQELIRPLKFVILLEPPPLFPEDLALLSSSQIQKYHFSNNYKQESLEPLVSEIYHRLPFPEAMAFAGKQVKVELKNLASQELIRLYTLRSSFLGAFPIPIIDSAFLIPLQILGVLKLSALYNHTWSMDRAKELALALGGGLGIKSLRASLIKAVPAIGSLSGAAFAGAATYALLMTAKQYFEEGAILDIRERKALQKIFENHYHQGSIYLKKLKSFQELQNLMKNKKISEKEFHERLEALARQKDSCT